MSGQSFGAFVLVIAALFCLLTAWMSATAPGKFAGSLGLAIVNAGGTNEVRAQYAGFFFAVAVVCIASLAGIVSRPTGFIVLATVFGGLITGRIVSLCLNGGMSGYTPTIVALYAIDTVGFMLSLAALGWDKAAA